MSEHAKGNTAVIDKPEGSAASKNIIETAMADGHFKTLATALQAAGLVETLKGTGPFTVFAPTDAAFEALPKGTLDGLLKDKAKLTSILKYHVVSGKVSAADLKALTDKDGKASTKTVEGHPLAVHIAGGKVHVGSSDAITVSKADVMASNGVIHVIDGILMPPK